MRLRYDREKEVDDEGLIGFSKWMCSNLKMLELLRDYLVWIEVR